MSEQRIPYTSITVCPGCGRHPIRGNALSFTKVETRTIVLDPEAARRHVGLTQMLGGHAPLADVMGDPNLFVTNDDLRSVMYVCVDCLAEKSVGGLLQAHAEREWAREYTDDPE